MKSIQDLAREAGAAQDEGLTYFEANELQRFHDLAIAQYREGLLAGVGEPIGFWAGNPERDAQPCYTADQMAAAVAIEREKTEKFESALEDLMFHVEEAMRNEPQPYEIEKAYERAAAIRGSDDR